MKEWLKINLLLLITFLILIGTFNYLMDPLWCFSHNNTLQTDQKGFNERQQKINLIHFSNFNYDAIMIGSSRVTLHDQTTIHAYKTFNMAADAMHPFEFDGYINYAKKINKKDFKVIIIGLDLQSISLDPSYKNINNYLNTSYTPFYRYKSLINYDNTLHSIKNIKYKLTDKKPFRTYNQNHIAKSNQENNDYVSNKISSQINDLRDKPLCYHRNTYLNSLKKIKQDNPNTNIIVFTTPLPAPILKVLLNSKNNQKIYNLWLHDILNIFGPFYHFLYSNSVTENYFSTFIDAGHYSTEVGNCINQKIFNSNCDLVKSNEFGQLITKENINNLLSSFSNTMAK